MRTAIPTISATHTPLWRERDLRRTRVPSVGQQECGNIKGPCMCVRGNPLASTCALHDDVTGYQEAQDSRNHSPAAIVEHVAPNNKRRRMSDILSQQQQAKRAHRSDIRLGEAETAPAGLDLQPSTWGCGGGLQQQLQQQTVDPSSLALPVDETADLDPDLWFSQQISHLLQSEKPKPQNQRLDIARSRRSAPSSWSFPVPGTFQIACPIYSRMRNDAGMLYQNGL
ncbi:hypothetical protein GMORB2_0167 [Geosmithia morbida]|uniref:Uncharacterized protein n=1 Tax=Geosmithia morbida TaxID=1094350 RepID=A0A9P4Z2R8_9HYPO|nr:uncharacterized protein GMORB2_0167 [Geosmithia morbida]KAF4126431.1 hypothetical protein GMORB2_0167 [Geosmithia morbida]